MSRKLMDVRKISFIGLYVAIIIALSFIPQLGYITVGTVSITTIPVFVAIATYHMGLAGAISSSITFGVASYIMSITLSPTPLADPVLMMVPRFLLGIFVYLIYKLLGDIKLWKFVLLAAITVVLNTTLFTAFLYMVASYRENFFSDSLYFWLTLIYVNFIVEFSIAIGLSILLFSLIKYLIKSNEEHYKQVW